MGCLTPPTLGIPVLVEPTSMCRALIGLADIEVVGVIGWTMPMQVYIASTLLRTLAQGDDPTIVTTRRIWLTDRGLTGVSSSCASFTVPCAVPYTMGSSHLGESVGTGVRTQARSGSGCPSGSPNSTSVTTMPGPTL